MAVSNLDYLKEYSDNDIEFVIEMVELFISKTPEFLKEMEDALIQNEFENIGKVAHKMKPSMTFMSISNGKELCIQIEEIVNQNPFDENLKVKVQALNDLCNTAFIELEISLKELK